MDRKLASDLKTVDRKLSSDLKTVIFSDIYYRINVTYNRYFIRTFKSQNSYLKMQNKVIPVNS